MTILVTGAAGFIGSFVCEKLLGTEQTVIGIDNLNNSYDVNLKRARLHRLDHPKFQFFKQDITESGGLAEIFKQNHIASVIHLAAEAGVTQGEEKPEQFINSNIVGFGHVLENCRHHSIKHLIYASTAAVYGDNEDFPVTENSNSDHPLTLYGATKKANEVLANSYAEQFAMRITGLRFFSVYGPWARPDMALCKFTRQIMQNEPIKLHNKGNHTRDMIYIDDLVDAITVVWSEADVQATEKKHQIYNIGNQQAIGLKQMVQVLEQQLGKHTEHHLVPLQKGEIIDNQADASKFYRRFGIMPKVAFEQGVEKFLQWYREYHQ
ncbi:MAG: NAD-dependent epimerase/dehydratase family protein [Marinicella sp.]